MNQPIKRIASVSIAGEATLALQWQDGGESIVDLTGWIATGGPILAGLRRREVFTNVFITDYGTAIGWGDEDSELAIDSVHLALLAAEQTPFTASDAEHWQRIMRLSNQEAAGLLGVALSTWNAYKGGTQKIPVPIGMLCRAVRRDPVLMQAHYRPRQNGRPKTSAAA